MTTKWYPVSNTEIAEAAVHPEGMTVYTRSDAIMRDGRTVPNVGAYGHPLAYKYIRHNGKIYGVPKNWGYELADTDNP